MVERLKLPNEFLYHVAEVQPFTEHVSQIFLQPMSESVLAYEAGQYVQVIHHDLSLSPLSIACAPIANHTLEFHLFHPAAGKPKAQALQQLAYHKNEWRLSGPFGTCTVSRLHPTMPIIFLAHRTGFAPIKAIIEMLSQSSHCPPIHLYWGVNTRHDLYLTALVEKWATQLTDFVFTPVFIKEVDEHGQIHPHLLQETMLRDHDDFSRYQVYVSGPESLVRAVFLGGKQKGLQREFFYSDVFAG